MKIELEIENTKETDWTLMEKGRLLSGISQVIRRIKGNYDITFEFIEEKKEGIK